MMKISLMDNTVVNAVFSKSIFCFFLAITNVNLPCTGSIILLRGHIFEYNC